MVKSEFDIEFGLADDVFEVSEEEDAHGYVPVMMSLVAAIHKTRARIRRKVRAGQRRTPK